VGESVGKWVHEQAVQLGGANYELIDLVHFELPLLDEPVPASQKKYTKEHTKRWSAKVESLDAFIFVTPEYNHSTSGALKNAIDFLGQEWANKAAGFVGYGSVMGARAVEHLRLIMAELRVATVRTQVGLSLFTDFENYKAFKPAPHHAKNLKALLDEVILWGGAMKTVRAAR
jgi:NAD(P)H-dependent FMN reductase